ncbi:MAG TPA: hypothetical protein PK467_06375 [Candidatus Wallbacteria bacterium]|nr:hypothetical protein [Candidatus Wallbacteria bacterium]
MKNILLLIFVFIILGANAAYAQSDFDFNKVKKDGDLFEERSIDLDRDGTPEKVALIAYGIKSDSEEIISYCGQLVVMKNNGGKTETIWSGPKYKEEEIFNKNEFRFVFAGFGLEPIEALGDIFGDSSAVLLSPRAQSDVRPSTYRVYAWKNGAFSFVRSQALLRDEKDGDKFNWKDAPEGEIEKRAWIGKFNKINAPGESEAEIWAYEKGKVMIGKAVLKATPDGFGVTKWIEPLKAVE